MLRTQRFIIFAMLGKNFLRCVAILFIGFVFLLSVRSFSFEWHTGRVLQWVVPSVGFDPSTCDNCISILIMGQSNAANHGQGRIYTDFSGLVFFADRFYPLIDPVRGCSGYGASPWPRVAQKLNEIGKKLIVICLASGGTSVEEWLPGTTLHSATQRVIRSYIDTGGKIDYAVWHQGETDSMNCMSDDVYAQSANRVLDSVTSIVPSITILLGLASWPFGSECQNESVREAQRQILLSRNDVRLLFDFDQLDNRFRSDGVHFNSLGLERYASSVVSALVK